MLFIPIDSILSPLVPPAFAGTYLPLILYTAKSLLVLTLLTLFWKSYDELKIPKINIGHIITTILFGAVVFILWINMTWPFASMGEAKAFDPYALPGMWVYLFIVIRIFGASVVVPVFEEIFWRSFILRYIIDPDFKSVKIGTFTWPSFIISSILFGLEHNLWLAGIMAGIFYNILLYRTKNLYYCIIAHGITNLALGLYVIKTGE